MDRSYALQSAILAARVKEHCTRNGNDSIYEVICAVGRRGPLAVYVEPLCDCTANEHVIVERRFFALVPPHARLVIPRKISSAAG